MVQPPRRSFPFFLLVAVAVLAGVSRAAPRTPDRVGTVPVFAFPVGHAVNVFWLPPDRTFVYYGNGDYFRWQGTRWTAAPLASGPWQPPAAGVVIPRALTFGPPPPIDANATYFAWWRKTAAPWWRLHHPHWWAVFGNELGQYRAWREQALPLLRARARFWHLAGGIRLRPAFASGRVVIQPSQIQSRILTRDLSGRYYRNARRAYEWTHPWSAYGSAGGVVPAWPWVNPYPIPWGGSFEFRFGGPGFPGPWGYIFQDTIPFGGFLWSGDPGDDEPLSPWMGNPLDGPWNGVPDDGGR